jgi:phosphatidylglycerol:prolipoprotein diacylglycerol transferase
MMSSLAWCEGRRTDSIRVGEATVKPSDTLRSTVQIAVITFAFDPFVQLFGDLTVRWGAIALTVLITVSIVLAGLLARGAALRADDVVFITVGVVPGAVIGGRVGYLLIHPGFAGGELTRLIDPSLGGLELGLAVVGGTLTGSYVASLLQSAPLGRWLHLAAAPALLAIGAGKLTMILTGSGQGVPSDAAWATAYLGPGPWGSLVPELPSVPSQAVEGVATLAILVVLTLGLLAGAFGRRDGRLFFVGIGLWAIARAATSTTWRDPVVAAGLPTGGLIAVAIAAGCAIAVVVLTVRNRGSVDDADAGPRADLAWPDPETRPPF